MHDWFNDVLLISVILFAASELYLMDQLVNASHNKKMGHRPDSNLRLKYIVTNCLSIFFMSIIMIHALIEIFFEPPLEVTSSINHAFLLLSIHSMLTYVIVFTMIVGIAFHVAMIFKKMPAI